MNICKILGRHKEPKEPPSRIPNHRVTIESLGNPCSDRKSVVMMQRKYINAGVPFYDVEINVVHTTTPKSSS